MCVCVCVCVCVAGGAALLSALARHAALERVDLAHCRMGAQRSAPALLALVRAVAAGRGAGALSLSALDVSGNELVRTCMYICTRHGRTCACVDMYQCMSRGVK